MSFPASPIPAARVSGRISDEILRVALEAARALDHRPLTNPEVALLVLIAAPSLDELLARREADQIAPPLTVVADNVIHLPVVR